MEIDFYFQLILGLHVSKNGIPNIVAISASKISNLKLTNISLSFILQVVKSTVVTILLSANLTEIGLSLLLTTRDNFWAVRLLIKLLVAPESTKQIIL